MPLKTPGEEQLEGRRGGRNGSQEGKEIFKQEITQSSPGTD